MSVCVICRSDNSANAKYCSNCGAPLRRDGEPQRVRKRVSVLFTDVVDSTALGRRLDAEPLARVLDRFFDTARQVLQGNGGAVQKNVGDAVMAVFGLPRVNEDDAQRAVRAAVELHQAVRVLNGDLRRDWDVELALHTAISTGDVVVEEGDTWELGRAAEHINRVARLIKLADADRILVDQTTYQVVREIVRVDSRYAATPGNGSQAFSVLGLREQPALPHRIVVPMIGREWELDMLRIAYEGVLRRRSSYLMSVLGPPGIGKTRLVEEFTRRLSRRPDPRQRPLALRGQCVRPIALSTFSPMRQIVRQAADIRSDTSTEEALRKLDRLAKGDEPVVARLAAFLGLSGKAAEPEDTIRAICRALRALAVAGERVQPLVLVVDDLHWAEKPMLDAVLRVKEALSDAPALLVGVSREVLFDESKEWEWAGWMRDVGVFTLQPLDGSEASQMVEHILLGGAPDPDVVRAIVERAGGTPLDVEALMANLLEEGVLRLTDGRWELTRDLRTPQGMLRGDTAYAARIDRFEEDEQLVITRAALVGMVFRTAEVAALLPDLELGAVMTTLRWLVRRDLFKLAPETAIALEPGDEVYTFSHSSYQQAAYERLTLEDRANLHEQYARWLAVPGEGQPSMAEGVAFHFEQAHDNLVALRGEGAERAAELVHAAGEWYARAGRGHMVEATSPVASVTRVLERAIRFLPDDSPERFHACLDLADTLQEPDPDQARKLYDEVIVAAQALGHRGIQRHAELGRMEMRWYLDRMGDLTEDRMWLDDAIEEFEADEAGSPHLAAKAYRLLSFAHVTVGNTKASRDAADRAVDAIEKTSDARLHAKIISMRCVNAFWGPTPLETVVQEVEDAVRWARANGMISLEAQGLLLLARAAAMRGDFERARAYIVESRKATTGQADLLTLPTFPISEGTVEMLAGNLKDAERIVRTGYEAQQKKKALISLATYAALLARILMLSGRDADAELAIADCRRRIAPAQRDPQIKWRQTQAILLARGEDLVAAEELARAAVELSEKSEQPLTKAEAFADLAGILLQVGKLEESLSFTDQALRLYREKGHMVAVLETERLRDRIRAAGG